MYLTACYDVMEIISWVSDYLIDGIFVVLCFFKEMCIGLKLLLGQINDICFL